MDYKKDDNLIFVYGTLKKGCKAHYLLNKEKFLGKGFTLRKFGLVSFDTFPAIVEGIHPSFHIVGEVYLITPTTLKKLDEYENCPSFYVRKKEKILLDDKILNCYVYILNKENVKRDYKILTSKEEFLEWDC